MNLSACVMAGGFGNRLRPLTSTLPKPMLPVANYPMIDYVIGHLKAEGINNIVYTLGYLPEKIIDWSTGYSGLCQHFVVEENPLGTCGAVCAVKNMLSDVFFVLSGDAIENIDLKSMLDFHLKSGADVTMATTKADNPSLYGVVETDENGFAVNFIEKPSLETVAAMKTEPRINCGVYVINKSALSKAPKGVCDFSKDFFPILKNEKKLACFKHDGYWCDLGDIKSYFKANFFFSKNNFYPPVDNYNRLFCESIFEGASASLFSRTARNSGNVFNSILGNHAFIDKNVIVNNCIVLDNACVTNSSFGSIIGANFNLNVDISDINLSYPTYKENFIV